MKTRSPYIFFLTFLLSSSLWAQLPINGFANVTGISGNILTVNTVNEFYDTFEDGELIIIMQMQDDVIGTNTTNVSTFGNLGSIQSAGLYEIAQISTHTESGLVPTSITLSSALVNTYRVNSNASVQIISYRYLGTNFTTLLNIGTLPWNGTTGGVTAMYVTGILTVNNNITANGSGFAGGVKNTPNGYSNCDDATYITSLSTRYAGKAEGIYKSTTAGFGAGRGKMLNAGGGGNDVNGGGGGGGNYTSGGGGGSGWTASGTGCSPIAGGLGGLSLSTSINGNRIFMGGGGGGGHENDGVGTVGAAGGGIIMMSAATFSTSTLCSGVTISANGLTAGNASNDGAGGGGAGGTVIFNVGSFNVVSACPLVVSANGGNGGSANASSSGAHGGGGGGGQGAVIYSAAQPVTNIVTGTAPGTGGVSCSGCSSSVNGSTGSGTSNAGIITSASGPLPVELLSFTAHTDASGNVLLEWVTAVEKNSNKFIIQRMQDDKSTVEVAELKTKGNNSHYAFTDQSPGQGTIYYRLREVDNDDISSYKPWIEVNLKADETSAITVYPNPLQTGEELFIHYEGENSSDLQLELIGMASKTLVSSHLLSESGSLFKYSLPCISAGMYTVKIKVNGKFFYKKLLVLK